MANVVQISKIMDGPSHVTLHCFMQSDGASGELTNYVLLDPSVDLVPAMPKQQDLILKQVWYEMGGFSVIFSFDGVPPWPFWVLTPGASLHHDWRFFGGLRDRAGGGFGLTATGKLLISTRGFVDAADAGAFVIWMEKRDRQNPQPD